MAMVKVPLGTGKEPEVATEGSYELVVRRFEPKLSKKGNPMYEVQFAFADQPDLKSFRQWFGLPDDMDTPERQVGKTRELRRFVNAFGVRFDDAGVLPFPGQTDDDVVAFDIEDMVGAAGTGFVTVEHNDDYGDSNRVRFRGVK